MKPGAFDRLRAASTSRLSARRIPIGETIEVRHIPHGQPVEIKPSEAVEPLKGHHGRYGALAVRRVDDGSDA